MRTFFLLFIGCAASVAQVLPPQPTELEIRRVRVFADPLSPVGETTPEDNAAVAAAVNAWSQRPNADDYAALETFLAGHPSSPWAPGIRVNLAEAYYLSGRFSRALAHYQAAWLAAKDSEAAKAWADEAAAGYLGLLARIGRFAEIQAVLDSAATREFSGKAGQEIAHIRNGLYEMLHVPGKSFKCGPMALWAIQKKRGVPVGAFAQYLFNIQSPQTGFDLREVWEMSEHLGMGLQMAYREPGSEVIVPAVVHWKVDHYGALTGSENGRFHVEDVTFVQDFWLTASALDEEASGYLLVPAGPLPAGWRPVGVAEAANVRGKGNTSSLDAAATGANDPTVGGGGCPKGMPRASVHAMLVSLKIDDIPVGYTPPAGPPVWFQVTYSQRDTNPPAANEPSLGPGWRMDWFSHVAYHPNDPGAAVSVFPRGGGEQVYRNFSPSGPTEEVSEMTWASPSRLERSQSTGVVSFVRTLPDGSREYFEQDDGVPVSGGTIRKKAYLTRVVDPAGRQVLLGYDSLLRVVTLTDAFGRVTTIDYDSVHPFRIVTVTDPFGRFATFGYGASGRLVSITDVLGLTSSFTYDGDFVSSMTTPYGTTSFAFGVDGLTRWLETTDPQGDKERVEYRNDWPGRNTASGDPAMDVPSAPGLLVFNQWLGARNTFYWDKKAYAEGAEDFSKAHIFHWLHSPQSVSVTGRVLESEKKPFSSRVWYNYVGSTHMAFSPGTTALPTKIARVVDGPNGGRETQLIQRAYNAAGNVISETDPLGRVTTYTYAPNGVDLLTVQAGGQTVFAATYTTSHLPETVTDAAGQTTAFTYNAKGQSLTITDAQNQVTSLTYNAQGYLTTLDGPLSDDTLTATWDTFGRVATITGPDGYQLAFEYDAMDRPTKVTYPDGSSETTTYEKLHVKERTERDGRTTQFWHNKLGQLIAQRDAMGRWTGYDWCRCGDLRQLRDALGRVTKWKHDVQGRITEKIYPDNTRETYTYDLSSRLSAITDALGQVRVMRYNRDDTLAREQFFNEVNETADVTYTWDAAFRRLASVNDGEGTTQFTYHPYGNVGGGRMASVDGPLAGDTVATAYDPLGRLTSQTIAGIGRAFEYDAGSRLTKETNPLGEFLHSYVGGTGRLASVTAPNGLVTALSYLPNAQDRRLGSITHTGPGAAAVSSFSYGYDIVGRITSWTQNQTGHTLQPMSAWTIAYDAADQLTGVEVAGQAAEREAFSYDPAGNRTSAQQGSSVTGATFNHLNQITNVSGGGKLRFTGTTDEPANVTVQNKAATMLSATSFTAEADVTVGTNAIPVSATDGNGNTRTNTYQVVVPTVPAHTFHHDAVGNLLSDGERTYKWDAKNRLIEAKRGADTYRWAYNAFDQRVSESKNGQLTKRWVWTGGNQPAEERDAAGNVTRRFYPQGFQEIANSPFQIANFYVTKDHLGSIREVLDSAGEIVSSYSYDAWGRRTSHGDANISPFGYTGHYEHEPLGLMFTLYRAYDPVTGRWLSRDPIGEEGGMNLYGYVSNNPINLWDPLGLKVEIVQHSVAGVGNHVFLLITPDNGGPQRTLSGFNRSRGSDPFSKLFNSKLNAIPDNDLQKMNDGMIQPKDAKTICPPKGMSDQQFIDALIQADSNYENWKNHYFALPFVPGTYNSNSYVAGLLNAVGLPGSKIVGGMPGWQPGGSKSPPPFPGK